MRRPPAPPLPLDAAALAARRPALAPFRADLRGRLRSADSRGRFRAGLGAAPPAFRLDVFHPVTGSTLLSMGLGDGVLRAVWPGEGECLDAAADADLLGRLVGIRVDPAEWLPLLTGHVWPAGPEVEIVDASYPPMAISAGEGPPPLTRNRVLVSARSLQGGVSWEAELLAERQGLALRARRVGPDGGELVVEYPKWRAGSGTGGPEGPERIVIRSSRQRMQLELEVRAIAAGGPEPARLMPTRPAGCRELTRQELESRLPFAAVDPAQEP